jgi:hypothetical protein
MSGLLVSVYPKTTSPSYRMVLQAKTLAKSLNR